MIARFAQLGTCSAALLLALTGLSGWWVLERMGGWGLILHTLAAPLFIVGLTALVVASRRCGIHSPLVVRTFAVLGLLSIGSIWAASLGRFGYSDTLVLLDVHRWAGLGIALLLAALGVAWATRRRGEKAAESES